jgi:TRAP-type C4-dicarboxylate transport system permease small subunit
MDSEKAIAEQEFKRYDTQLDTSPFWLKFKKLHFYLLMTSSIFMTVSICIASAMRYFLKIDFFGLEEFVLISACILYFIGAAQGSFERSHLNADFMETFMAGKGKLGPFLLVQKTAELLMSYVFVYWGVLMIQWCIKGWPVTPVWHIPFLIPEVIVSLSFLFMAIYTTAHYILLVKAFLASRADNDSRISSHVNSEVN